MFSFDGVENMMFGGFDDENLDKSINALIRRMMEKYEYLGCGRNRIVFALKSKNYVIKVPLNLAGNSDNSVEAKRGVDFGYPVAKAKRVIIDDFCCAVMEYVEHADRFDNELPDWTGFVDCGQVGFTKKGELVAYDFGYN